MRQNEKPDYHSMTEKERLIEKLYLGRCSREELEELLDQFLQDTGAEEDPVLLERLWQELAAQPELEDARAAVILEKTLSKIDLQGSDHRSPLSSLPQEATPSKVRRHFFQRLSAAAAILLLISATLWLWWQPADLVQVETAYGQQKTVVLPDQSRVKLNAHSSISFSNTWDQMEDRKVWLEGEAYFEVRKNLEHEQKFQVITRDLTVEVLGTVFNVNTREESTMVFLEEGLVNVEVQETQEDIRLDPGEMITYTKATRQPIKRKIETEAPASWKDGTILLQNASLRSIVDKMEEIYGLSTRVDNKTLLDQTFNFPMPVNNLDTAILLLQESTDLVIERSDGELVIR
jgi:ferric-dicitrate binding protein FerR (iron transport regulator)